MLIHPAKWINNWDYLWLKRKCFVLCVQESSRQQAASNDKLQCKSWVTQIIMTPWPVSDSIPFVVIDLLVKLVTLYLGQTCHYWFITFSELSSPDTGSQLLRSLAHSLRSAQLSGSQTESLSRFSKSPSICSQQEAVAVVHHEQPRKMWQEV